MQNYLKNPSEAFHHTNIVPPSGQFYRFKVSESKCRDSLAHVYLKQSITESGQQVLVWFWEETFS